MRELIYRSPMSKNENDYGQHNVENLFRLKKTLPSLPIVFEDEIRSQNIVSSIGADKSNIETVGRRLFSEEIDEVNDSVEADEPRFYLLSDLERAEYIVNTVCHAFNIRLEHFKSNLRYPELVAARAVAVHFIRSQTNLQLKVIGHIIRMEPMDHASIIYLTKIVNNAIQSPKSNRFVYDYYTTINDLMK